jgi:hypothetical protein
MGKLSATLFAEGFAFFRANLFEHVFQHIARIDHPPTV